MDGSHGLEQGPALSVRPPPLTFSASLRYDLVRRTLQDLSGIESVLEIGAGEGAVGARLAQTYRYVGVEPDPEASAVARTRVEPSGGQVVCGDVSALDPGAVFDLVCAFEVLEHVERDAETLATWAARVRPGGWVMLSVPPFQRRFGPSDRAVGHFRRYEPEQMRELLLGTGLLPPPAAVPRDQARLGSRGGRQDARLAPGADPQLRELSPLGAAARAGPPRRPPRAQSRGCRVQRPAPVRHGQPSAGCPAAVSRAAARASHRRGVAETLAEGARTAGPRRRPRPLPRALRRSSGPAALAADPDRPRPVPLPGGHRDRSRHALTDAARRAQPARPGRRACGRPRRRRHGRPPSTPPRAGEGGRRRRPGGSVSRVVPRAGAVRHRAYSRRLLRDLHATSGRSGDR